MTPAELRLLLVDAVERSRLAPTLGRNSERDYRESARNLLDAVNRLIAILDSLPPPARLREHERYAAACEYAYEATREFRAGTPMNDLTEGDHVRAMNEARQRRYDELADVSEESK